MSDSDGVPVSVVSLLRRVATDSVDDDTIIIRPSSTGLIVAVVGEQPNCQKDCQSGKKWWLCCRHPQRVVEYESSEL